MTNLVLAAQRVLRECDENTRGIISEKTGISESSLNRNVLEKYILTESEAEFILKAWAAIQHQRL